jgi:hypothetical protein
MNGLWLELARLRIDRMKHRWMSGVVIHLSEYWGFSFRGIKAIMLAGIQKGSVQFIMFYLEVAPQLYLDVIQWLGRAGSNTQGRATT